MSIPTIDDVAKTAGVSKSTVSRVLSGNHPYVSDLTKGKVLEAVEQLGYRPSGVARSLRSKQTLTVGFLVSDVTNPFYADVYKGVEDAAIKYGYNVFLCNANYELERGLNLINSLIDRRVDGIIIMSSVVSESWIKELNRNKIPVVVQDFDFKDPTLIYKVINTDFKPGIQEAVEHLYHLGHRRFAHISGPLHLVTSRQRRDTFLESLSDLGIQSEKIEVVEGNYLVEGGRGAFNQLFSSKNKPTAIFASNDLMAFGFLLAAKSNGLRIPHDLSIIGLDDIWLAAEIDPPLSTVAIDRHQMGFHAMSLLLGLMKTPSKEDESFPGIDSVRTSFVIRGTTGVPPNFGG